MSLVRATPFHARAADANRGNRWTTRNGWTVAASYSDPDEEAMAARFAVVMADISWRWRVLLDGARAPELVRRLMTRDATALAPNEALKALWLADGGGVRGAGVVARRARQTFELVAAASDTEWISSAAALFDVSVRDISREQAGLAIVGPQARLLIAALGFDPSLESLRFRDIDWRGAPITLSRFGEHFGYEIWCKADDAPLIWDRVARAGALLGLMPAGLDAMDLLDLEAGVPRPGRDYDGAVEPDAAEPIAAEWRLSGLIDAEHADFNGAQAMLGMPRRVLAGLLIDSRTPAPFAPVSANGAIVGRTLSSRYAPALRRAIALVQLDQAHAAPGTVLTLTLPAARGSAPAQVAGRVAALPFLPPPEPPTA